MFFLTASHTLVSGLGEEGLIAADAYLILRHKLSLIEFKPSDLTLPRSHRDRNELTVTEVELGGVLVFLPSSAATTAAATRIDITEGL